MSFSMHVFRSVEISQVVPLYVARNDWLNDCFAGLGDLSAT